MTEDAALAGGQPRPAALAVGRPRSFDDDQLVRAALDLGPTRLNLREIARRLGVPRTTVYNRVRNVDELGALVLGCLMGEVLSQGWAAPVDGTWRECLASWVLHFRDAMLCGGAWIQFFDPVMHIDTHALDAADSIMERLVDEGFPEVEAGRAVGLVSSLMRDSVITRTSLVFSSSLQGSVSERARAGGPTSRLARTSGGDPAEEEAQFSYNLERALDGIELTLRGPRRRGSRRKP